MTSAQPHFFLRCEARVEGKRGEWTFALSAADGSAELTACDEEFDVTSERLELLAVIRALEALDQPSVVTIVSGARTVRRAVAEGLDEWRRNGWMWECYGEMAPIKNRDLWQRLDRALCFHKLETRRVFRIDAAHLDRPEDAAMSAGTRSRTARAAQDDVAAGDGEDASPDSAIAAAAATAAALARRMKETWHRARRRTRNRADGMLMSGTFGASVGGGSWRV
jgi:ribonuclease HI